MARDLPTGILRDPYGFRVSASIGTPPHRLRKEKHFTRDTKIKTMTGWQEDARVELRAKLKRSPAPIVGTFAFDINRYLALVKAMPTYEQRRDHLQMWADALGADRLRIDITVNDIRAVLQQWRKDGLAAATCNKRRTALMHLWSELDGKDGRNPVRAVKKFRVDDPLPRGLDPHVVDAALLKAPRCKTRACARVMLWLGMRPVELRDAKPEDIDLEHRTAIIRTGKGGRTRAVGLTPQAVSAWKEFAAAGCWDEPTHTPLTKKGRPRIHREKRIPDAAPMGRLVKKWTGLKDLRVYDMRHTYGTQLARKKTRLDVIGAMMGHSTLDLTKRYTLAAVGDDALAATANLARKPAKARKRRKSMAEVA